MLEIGGVFQIAVEGIAVRLDDLVLMRLGAQNRKAQRKAIAIRPAIAESLAQGAIAWLAVSRRECASWQGHELIPLARRFGVGPVRCCRYPAC
jgi:hypothetical protein